MITVSFRRYRKNLHKIALIFPALGFSLSVYAKQVTGHWQIDYKGTLNFVGPSGTGPIWMKQQYDTFTTGDIYDLSSPSPNVHSGIQYGMSGGIEGDVTIRLKWVGSGTPSTYVNYKIHSSTGVVCLPSDSAEAYNGFSTMTQAGGAAAEDWKLIQPGKTLQHETTVHVSGLSSNIPVYVQCIVEAAIDPRYARVKASSIPEEYQVKGPTTSSSYQFYDHLWMLAIAESVSYNWATSIAANPIEVVDGSANETRTVGLPVGVTTTFLASGTTSQPPSTVTLHQKSKSLVTTYIGEVAKDNLPNEKYTFNEDLFHGLVSENLPSGIPPFEGWDVEPLGPYSLDGEEIITTYVGNGNDSITIVPRLTSTDNAHLNYQWNDKLVADSKLTLNFVDEFTNSRLIAARVLHDNTPIQYVFANGTQGMYPNGYVRWDSGASRSVYYDGFGYQYQAAAAVVSIAGTAATILLPESLGTIPELLALAGASMSLGTSVTGTNSLTPDDPYETDTDFVKHVISFTPELIAAINGMTPSNKKTFLADKMIWKAEYLPQYTLYADIWDHYGPQGYIGVTLVDKKYPTPGSTLSIAKRFTYQGSSVPYL